MYESMTGMTNSLPLPVPKKHTRSTRNTRNTPVSPRIPCSYSHCRFDSSNLKWCPDARVPIFRRVGVGLSRFLFSGVCRRMARLVWQSGVRFWAKWAGRKTRGGATDHPPTTQRPLRQPQF